MKILVTDDDAVSRTFAVGLLKKIGHEAVTARDGEEALNVLAQHGDIALMVVDWIMPRMDGIELVRRVRSEFRNRYLHVVMTTSLKSRNDMLKALDAGVDAFFTKPLDPLELSAQIRVVERMWRLENQIAGQLEILQQDLGEARIVQEMLLPRNGMHLQSLQFRWSYRPCNTLGGDIFNCIRLDENHVAVYILDVAGHGVQAALLSVALSHMLEPSLDNGLLKRPLKNSAGYEIVPPQDVMESLNRRFHRLLDCEKFFTMFYGVLNTDDLHLRYSLAGHPPPMIVRGNRVFFLDTCGDVPVGIIDQPGFSSREVAMSPGDWLLLYTDGAIEGHNAERVQFGPGRLMRSFAQSPRGDLQSALKRVDSEIDGFLSGIPLQDDITLMGIELRKQPESLEGA